MDFRIRGTVKEGIKSFGRILSFLSHTELPELYMLVLMTDIIY